MIQSFEHIFNELDIAADPFALCELQGRCDMAIERQPFAAFHYILSGEGELLLQNRAPINISSGSFVLLPAHEAHTIRSHGLQNFPVPECHPAELELLSLLQTGYEIGNERQKLIAICTQVQVGFKRSTGLIDLVREPLIVPNCNALGLDHTVDNLLRELAHPRLGSKALVRSLILQCIIELFRNRIEAGDPSLTWMAVLKDERLWGALKSMLDNPEVKHSLESLADQAGMSRSSFAQHFSEAYGAGPMELLRDVRMRLAGNLLLQTNLPVKRIADQIGFKSRTSFTKAFETYHGCPPKEFRKGQ